MEHMMGNYFSFKNNPHLLTFSIILKYYMIALIFFLSKTFSLFEEEPSLSWHLTCLELNVLER